MSFKKIRYNLIVIGLVALVCCYMGMSIFFAPASGNINNSGSAQDEPIEEPLLPDEDEEDGDDQEIEIPSDAIELINYGLDILNNGKGYESTYTASIVNVPSGIDTKPEQKLKSIISRGVNSKGENVSIQKDFYSSDYYGVGDTMLARYFRGFYDNQTTGKVNVVETSDYDVKAQTYNLEKASRNEVVSMDDVINEFKVVYTRDYPIIFTKTNCRVLTDDSRSNPVYRTICVSVNIDSLSQNYLDFYTSTKQMKDINYKEVKVTFNIAKKTGYIYSIKRTETLEATALNVPVLGTMGVKSSIKIEQVFKNINKEIKLPDSL